MNREELFKYIYRQNIKMSDYLKTVPSDLSSSVFDNGYVECLYGMNEKLIDFAFDEYAESVKWFLYDWYPNAKAFPVGDEEGIEIKDIDQYIEFIKHYEGFQ